MEGGHCCLAMVEQVTTVSHCNIHIAIFLCRFQPIYFFRFDQTFCLLCWMGTK